MKLEDIKAGSFYFYSERYYGDDYADSLIAVRNVDGVDMAHPIAANYSGKYINKTTKNWLTDWPVATFYDENCWKPCDYTPDCGDPAKWMKNNYPLSNSTSNQ